MKKTIRLRIYAKPLVPGDMAGIDIKKILESGKRSLLARLRGKLLQQTAFSPAAKKTLARAVQVKVMPSSLRVTASHPAFLPLIKGQKREQMTWLTKARAPIPIVLDDGTLIFRNATPASMQRGAWWHPGRNPATYVDKARELTKKFLRTKVLKEIQRNLHQSMARAMKEVKV
jgi:hypothetical protein